MRNKKKNIKLGLILILSILVTMVFYKNVSAQDIEEKNSRPVSTDTLPKDPALTPGAVPGSVPEEVMKKKEVKVKMKKANQTNEIEKIKKDDSKKYPH